VLLERDYPAPIVQLESAMRQARQRLSDWKQQQQSAAWRQQQQQIVSRHASRKRPVARPKANSITAVQLNMFEDN